jgi:8-hydroxy-5-deazaflavin:NADPH oxidoreductase
MRIGVIGAGRVGGGLAELWRRAGHDVRVSTRDTIRKTAANADVVVLAVPAAAAVEVLDAAGPLEGKVLVDATNNVSGGPDGGQIAAHAQGARTVKAFNTVFAALYDRIAAQPERPTVVLCGDDDAAKEIGSTLARDAGFEPVDAGGLEVAPDVEAMARLVITIAYRQGRGPFFYRFTG